MRMIPSLLLTLCLMPTVVSAAVEDPRRQETADKATIGAQVDGTDETAAYTGANESFFSPAVPPRCTYTASCTIDPDASTLQGQMDVSFTNDSSRKIDELMLRWFLSANSHDKYTLTVTADDHPVTIIPQEPEFLLQLAKPLERGETQNLQIKFAHTGWPTLSEGNKVAVSEFMPRIWWGYQTHDDYDVTIEIPEEYAVATSGLQAANPSRHMAKNVRVFGLYLGKGHLVEEAQSGDVHVRCLYRPAEEECARLLLKTAVDVIGFYRDTFGFYPYPNLTILPGMDYPAGGYPIATAMVVVHGQGRYDDRRSTWWPYIMAHEIGHTYWGEHVLDGDYTVSRDYYGCLAIGLGFYADQKYCKTRGINDVDVMHQYRNYAQQGIDTTVALTPEQLDASRIDYGNAIVHSKGYGIVSALATYLGQDAFERVYRRALREFSGRCMDRSMFQELCELDTGQDLKWFFDQWYETNRRLSYEISGHTTTRIDDKFATDVIVERRGTLVMPVPVQATFEDGTTQQLFTHRLVDPCTLTFTSTSPVKSVTIDPDKRLPMVSLEDVELSLPEQIQLLYRKNSLAEAFHLFQDNRDQAIDDASAWGYLGLLLYEGAHYPEAEVAFAKAADTAKDRQRWAFNGYVWQGQMLDLLGRREEATACYRKALDRIGDRRAKHSQYGIVVNRAWIEERLATPFVREWK